MSSSSSTDKTKKRELPPLFWYMETGDWAKASERVRRHPREVKMWATLRTKSVDDSGNKKTTGSKRLALHHACFKLRSAASVMAADDRDPFVEVCHFILLLIRLFPEAAGQRESRHGCLPLHLAAFASCAPRTPAEQLAEAAEMNASSRTGELMRNIKPAILSPASKPGVISRRVASDATTGTTDTVQTNMSAVHAEEAYTGCLGDKQMRRANQPQLPNPNVSVAMKSDIVIDHKREEMAVQVINALLDAYPKGIRVDSEGGRLPLHTACAGRSTPRVISTLVTAYPSAARHRNKDGFLPLHLAAHWGVSHPNVAITLLKAYPDATLGRNRWERTPLEEALCMAGENGRPHQGALVRALRKHPNYWTQPTPEIFGLLGSPGNAASTNRRGRGGAPVDIDESLPSIESSSEGEARNASRQYFGHQAILLDPVDEMEPQVPPNVPSPPIPASPSSFFSRLTGKVVEKKEEDLALNVSMATLVQNRRWDTILARLAANPLEAEQELGVATRGGFTATSGMTPLHYACERTPPVEVVNALIGAHPSAVLTRTMPGGNLPLHVACTWYASADVVKALLTADQTAATVTDELGSVALHSACFSGAEEEVIVALLAANGKAVLTRNKQGSRPVDICKRLRHENRRSVMALLTLKKEEIMARHRRSQSSGTWSEVASEASELSDKRGENGYRETDDLQDQGDGVEVSYNEEENQELLWV